MERRRETGADHREREDLAGEHAVGDAGQIAAFILFAGIWIADGLFLYYTTFLNQYVPIWVRIPIGAALLVVAGYVARTGLSIVFGEERAQPGVIRKGPFGFVRHPIYLSELLLYLGFLVMSISLAAALVWVIAFGFLHYISRHEEKLLLARFGDEYQSYMRDVPMWIPRLRRP